MKNVVLALAVILLASSLQAQNLEWARKIGDSTSIEVSGSVAIDNSGNVYTAGQFADSVDFDPGAGIFNLTAAGGDDIFITKFDSSGNFVWAKQISGPENERNPYIAIDAAGSIYLSGTFKDTVDFDPSADVHNLISAGVTADDVFIAKYNASGNLAWVKQIGSTGNEASTFITQDYAGNVYAAGTFQGTVDFNPGVAGYSFTALSAADAFIMKLDTTGQVLWARPIGGAAIIKSAASDPSNVYLTGQFSGAIEIGVYTLNSHSGSTDAFVCRLDNGGVVAWVGQLGGAGTDISYSIAGGGNATLYLTGYFQGTARMNPFDGAYTLTSFGAADLFVTKIDIFGNFYWTKQIGSNASEAGLGIAADGDANAYITGFFGGTTDFDPGSGTHNLTTAATTETYFLKLDASGNFVWAVATAGSDETICYAITMNTRGNIYGTGRLSGTTDFNPGLGVYTLTQTGAADVFVLKLSPTACATFDTISISICQGDGYLFNGVNRTTPGIYLDTLVNSANCDSILSLNLIVNANPNATITQAGVTVCAGGNTNTTLTANGGTAYAWSNNLGVGAAVNVSPTATTTYTVTVSDANNCSATASATVTVNQPNGEAIAITACTGTAYAFNGQNLTVAGIYYDTLTNAGGCDSLLNLNLSFSTFATGSFNESICAGESFLFNNQSLTVSGAYKDTLLASGGCDSILTLNLTVLALPQPIITQNTDTLSTGNFTGYQWLLEGNELTGATAQVLQVTQNGNYSVIVTDANGCSDTSAVLNVTGLGVFVIEDERWTIYPNPNQGNFKLEFSDNETREVAITDMVGRVIISGVRVTGQKEFHLNENPGVYFVHVMKKGIVVSRSLLHQRNP